MQQKETAAKAVRMERRGKELTSALATLRLCKALLEATSVWDIMRSLARPGDGVSLAVTQGQDRSSFDTEPGLRSVVFSLSITKAHLFLVQMCFLYLSA